MVTHFQNFANFNLIYILLIISFLKNHIHIINLCLFQDVAVFRDRLRRLLPLAGGKFSQRGIQVGGDFFAYFFCFFSVKKEGHQAHRSSLISVFLYFSDHTDEATHLISFSNLSSMFS